MQEVATKEQFHVSDVMDLRDLDCRVMWAHSYEALLPSLPPSLGSLWSAVMPRPPGPFSAQSVPSSDVTDMDEGSGLTTGLNRINNVLQEHALVLHQMTLTQGVVNSSDPRCLEPSTYPGEMSEHTPFQLILKE